MNISRRRMAQLNRLMLLRMTLSDKLREKHQTFNRAQNSCHALEMDRRVPLVALSIYLFCARHKAARLLLNRICATLCINIDVLHAAHSPWVRGRLQTPRENTRWRPSCRVRDELCIIPIIASWYKYLSEIDLAGKYSGMPLRVRERRDPCWETSDA